MKFFLSITFILVAIAACKPRQRETPPPTKLEEGKIDVSSIIKKRGADPVEALYEELVSQSDELKQLEKDLKALQKNVADSMDTYKQFADRNSSYYASADRKMESVGDSTLRRTLRHLINISRANYRDSVTSWNRIDSLAARRQATINDLHTLLKLVKTLPLIEAYQKQNVPKDLPSQKMVSDMDSMIRRLDTLTVIPPTGH